MVDRLTDLLRDEADRLDIPRPPIESILRDGREARRQETSRRRRAGVLVLVGVAASVVAVAVASMSSPGTPPAVDEAVPVVTAPPDTDDEPWPGPGGLRAALKTELLSADVAQRRAVEDDRVTRAEYRAGFERYRGCLSDSGYELSSVVQTGLVLDFGVPSDAVSSGADEVCYLRHFKAVDMAWQISRSDAILRETTLQAVNDCLVTNGIGVAVELTQAEALMQDAGLAEEECGLSPGQLDAAHP